MEEISLKNYRDHLVVFTQVQAMVSATEHIQYKGVSLGKILRIPFQDILRKRETLQNNPFYLCKTLIRHISIIVIRLILGTLYSGRKFSIHSKYCGKEYILVVCDFSGHVTKLASNLIEKFKKEKIIFLTSNLTVYKSIKKKLPYCLNAYEKIYYYRLQKLPIYYRTYKNICKDTNLKGTFAKLEIFSLVCTALEAIDYYKIFLHKIKISSVLTICDSHFNECIITLLAHQQRIPTYTNQHGEFADIYDYLPIPSDKIFVWGEKSKKRLIEHGVHPEKIIISGNPNFDRVYSWYLPQKQNIYTRMQKNYALKDNLPIITYLSPGLFSHSDLELLNELFKCFCQIADLPVNIIIKLHPSSDNIEIYRRWLNDLKINTRILLLQQEDLFDILAITDIAVTFYSSAGIEAIGFGIPTVTLNIINGIDLKDYITFAEDSIECKTRDDFRNILEAMITKPERYREEVERIRLNKSKYFKNSENFNTSEFIRDYIMNRLS